MFDKTKVEDALFGIVGLRQPDDPEYDIVDATNLASTSGYFVNDIPFAKVQFFFDAQDYSGASSVDFNALLVNTQKASIASVCNQVFTGEDFRDTNVFYRFANNNVDAETLADGFVGWRIQVADEKNVAFEIKKVILDFHSNFPNDIVLQLYNTGDPNPIQSEIISITEQHSETELNWAIDNSSDTYKGDYYLGYVKSASTPIPFKREYDRASDLSIITSLNILETQIPGHTGSTLFDLDLEDGLAENVGINPYVMVYDDYSDMIIQNKRLFGRAVQLDMAIQIMSTVISSIRSNRNQRIGDQDVVRIIQDLNGVDSPNGTFKVTGLRAQLATEVNTIRQEIDKLKAGYFGREIKTITLT